MSIHKRAKSNKNSFYCRLHLSNTLPGLRSQLDMSVIIKMKHFTNLLRIQRLLECSHNPNRRRTKLLLQTMLDDVSQVETDTKSNTHLLSKSDSMLSRYCALHLQGTHHHRIDAIRYCLSLCLNIWVVHDHLVKVSVSHVSEDTVVQAQLACSLLREF